MTYANSWIAKALTGMTVLALAACGGAAEGDSPRNAELAAADVVVYKSPTCGCCVGWAEHMREEGFTVAEVDLGPNEMSEKKVELGIPVDLGSCHTATVGDYVVEGHVPADAVRRLLDERPEVEGLAVRGMPIGSPGMEGPNPQPYDVIAFDRDARTVFARITPDEPAPADPAGSE